ncbi:hypothetical protein BDR26DRAFT_924534 [Obelidium mucronatum]|nr:hypothetical protein BDR26DRAFT_924534 [Obelidium mucronatum]
MRDLSDELAEERAAAGPPPRPLAAAAADNAAAAAGAGASGGKEKSARTAAIEAFSEKVNDFMAKALGFEKENKEAKAIRKAMDRNNGPFTREEKIEMFKEALQGNLDTTGMSPEKAAAAKLIQESADHINARGGISEMQMAFAEQHTDMEMQLKASVQEVKNALRAVFGVGPAVFSCQWQLQLTIQLNQMLLAWMQNKTLLVVLQAPIPGQETEAGVTTAATPEQFGKLAESVSSSDKVAASTSTTEKKNPVDNTKAATADGAQTTAKTVKKRPKS